MKPLVPVSAILPTRNRATLLARFLDSLADQTVLPSEIVICDASDNDTTQQVVSQAIAEWNDPRIRWNFERASRTGLAPQRNQAVAASSQEFVWFLDDDVILEPDCLEVLHHIVSTDSHVGGATATITNQVYTPPGRFASRLMRWFEDGRVRSTYASCCIGPGWTFLPDASADLPPSVPAEWMIGCCTLYRKKSLPTPAVPDHFVGGAIGEDLAASLHVAKTWTTLHATRARCFHDSQGGDHKRSLVHLSTQGLLNRYWIMTRVMDRRSTRDHVDFALMLLFGVASLLARPSNWGRAVKVLVGYAIGTWQLVFRSAIQ